MCWVPPPRLLQRWDNGHGTMGMTSISLIDASPMNLISFCPSSIPGEISIPFINSPRLTLDDSDFTKYEAQSVADWTSILRLASEFQMKNVRALAMKQLFPIASAAEKIDLANKYDIKDWLVPAYMELCTRTEELTMEEGKKLGVEAVIGVAQLRSQLLANVKTFVEKL